MSANIKMLWAGSCLPAKIFSVIMAGVILFNVWVGIWGEAIKNVLIAVIGTAALWFLCSSNMELLAYILLGIPVIFVIFLLALIVFDHSLIDVSHTHTRTKRFRLVDEEDDGDCDNCQKPSPAPTC